ncbi:hypothetical protein ACIGBH_41750 [Streptomyces sp. NPDC085929]|uniref:hypothetical protein n=1 Tax=Streptomyces sp. NPDC085929 TaxID=3365739 RepID=UPI0037D391DF
MKIVVLCGGESPERDVSLESGLAVAVALVELGHEVQVVDPAAAEPVRVGPTAIESELPRTAVELRGPELDEGKRRELMLAALTTGPVLPLLRDADLVYETKSHPQTARCHCPADLPYDLDEGLREQAMRAHRALGLGAKDYSRVDFRCDGRGVPHCLEVNACPGLRPLSGLGAAAVGAGWSYRELVGRVVALRAPVGVPALAG